MISPIGPPDSEIREEADAVLKYIIEPALSSLGVTALRADRLAEPGLITEQMIAAILEYDLCVVDLSGHNPNVFYELALAQAAERPVVLLKRAGQTIPFDVKDFRLIEYDLKPKHIMTGHWIPQLAEQVKHVLASGYKPPKLLRRRPSVLSDGIRSYFINARSEEFGDPPRYHEVAQQAEQYCCFLGITLKSWGRDVEGRVLEQLVRSGVNVKVMILDAANPGLPAIINERIPGEDLASVRRTAELMGQFFEKLAGRFPRKFKFRKIRDGIPHFQMLISEQTALVLQYMFGRSTSASPLQQFPKDTAFHKTFRDEFDSLWDANGPPKQRSVRPQPTPAGRNGRPPSRQRRSDAPPSTEPP